MPGDITDQLNDPSNSPLIDWNIPGYCDVIKMAFCVVFKTFITHTQKGGRYTWTRTAQVSCELSDFLTISLIDPDQSSSFPHLLLPHVCKQQGIFMEALSNISPAFTYQSEHVTLKVSYKHFLSSYKWLWSRNNDIYNHFQHLVKKGCFLFVQRAETAGE